MYSQATSMDEFHINFSTFGKYGEKQKTELLSSVKKRKRDDAVKRRQFGELYFTAEKHYER